MANEDNCPVEATLELIGGKYKALILWHLSQGILRFSELRQVIKGATPKMLTSSCGNWKPMVWFTGRCIPSSRLRWNTP